MLCDMAVSGVPILFHISFGAPDLPVTSAAERDSHQLIVGEDSGVFWIHSVVSLAALTKSKTVG